MIRRRVVGAFAGAGVALVTASLMPIETFAMVGADPPQVLRLSTTVRDFRIEHPDFDVASVSAFGHCAGNVAAALPEDRRPAYSGAGQRVVQQWYDHDGNPIMPYHPPADDGGLPGGHFDVDVFDGPYEDELYHKHEFDDAYDVDYVDIANDPNLLYDEIIGDEYPNDLRVEFYNTHHGVGTFIFEAGEVTETGASEDGFTAIFDPASLDELRVTFTSLNFMRHTKPKPVQKDPEDRDDSFAVRLYDVVTDELVYEIAVYHHGLASDFDHPPGHAHEGEDACGEPVEDDLGALAVACPGAVSDAESFGEWFRDVLGTNLSTAHVIELHRSAEGVYEHLSADFYPIDDRLFGNEGQGHNRYFTVSFTASFAFDACADRFLEFEGNDDAWVFIDDRLVIDLGGVDPDQRQYVALDRLDLEDGETYRLAFFYAHRRNTPESVFNLRTNLPLESSAPAVTSSYD